MNAILAQGPKYRALTPHLVILSWSAESRSGNGHRTAVLEGISDLMDELLANEPGDDELL